jgi:hypothetical protein
MSSVDAQRFYNNGDLMYRICKDHGDMHKPDVCPYCRIAELNAKYQELLYEVVNVHPNESRHETALRYIRERETPQNEASAVAVKEWKEKP